MYHPQEHGPPSSRHRHPPAVLAVQSRLRASLQESRRRHEECFGSCPTSRTKTVPQQEEAPAKKFPAEKKHLVNTASGRDDHDDDESITSAAELKVRSVSRPVKNPKSVTTGGRNSDVKVIFERNFRTGGEDNRHPDVLITRDDNPPPQKSRVATKAPTETAVVTKNVSLYKPKQVVVVDAVKAKAQTATQKGIDI